MLYNENAVEWNKHAKELFYMKRYLIVGLLLALCLNMAACGAKKAAKEPEVPEVTLSEAQLYHVPDPMAYPIYTFDQAPTTDELRQMAVKAMRDMLSIQWCTPKFMTYQKVGAVSEKQFSYVPEINLCGLPYTNGDAAIFNFFEYYDTTTGQLNFPGDGDEFNQIIGNTCTGSIMWAWSTVCDSLTGVYDNYHMTYLNKCYPVGDYVAPNSIDSYLQYGTNQICLDNGKEVMLQSYAKCLPADGLSSSPKNHGMMVISPAHVVLNADGTINGAESYLEIQDQRAGTGNVFYTQTDDAGNTYHYSGRTYQKYTFDQLYAEWYIPVSTAEFLGLEPYAEATVTHVPTTPDYDTVEGMFSGVINSNFPICIVKVMLTDEAGNATMLSRAYLDKTHVKSGEARSYTLGQLRSEVTPEVYEAHMKSGKAYTLSLEVTVSTGEVITVAQLPVKK